MGLLLIGALDLNLGLDEVLWQHWIVFSQIDLNVVGLTREHKRVVGIAVMQRTSESKR